MQGSSRNDVLVVSVAYTSLSVSLSDLLVPKKRLLDAGKFWDDEDGWEDQFDDSEIGSIGAPHAVPGQHRWRENSPSRHHRLLHGAWCTTRSAQRKFTNSIATVANVVIDLCEVAALLASGTSYTILTAFGSDTNSSGVAS